MAISSEFWYTFCFLQGSNQQSMWGCRPQNSQEKKGTLYFVITVSLSQKYHEGTLYYKIY